jgi:hypothetical protein
MITMRNVFLVTITSIFFFTQPAGAKEVAGDIVSVRGTVFIRQDRSTGRMPASPPKAVPGEMVYSGDVINTSSDGGVKILMKDKTIVDIGPSTLFKLDEYMQRNGGNRKAKIDLTFGKLRVAVSKKIQGDGKFEVKTKGATMGVRGTEFIVKEDIPDRLSKNDKSTPSNSAPAQKTEITVVQGKVDVATAPSVNSGRNPANAEVPKTVSLTAGTQLTTGVGAPAGSASGPVKVSENQMKSLTSEARVADNTFSKAVTIEPTKEGDQGQGRESKSKDDGQKPADSKTAENKPAENKPAENKSADDKGDAKSADAKSPESKQPGGEKQGQALAEQKPSAENKPAPGESRAPASSSGSSVAPSMTAIAPMINISLPPVVVAPPPIIDVPGAPVTPFQNGGFRNNIKRVHVTIVRGE